MTGHGSAQYGVVKACGWPCLIARSRSGSPADARGSFAPLFASSASASSLALAGGFAASAAFATASGALPASGPAQAKEAVPMVRASPRREPEIRTPREPSRAFESSSRSLTTDSSSSASFTPPRSLLSIRPSSRSRR